MLRITVNGESRALDVEAETPLLWVLRDTLGMKGTKYGCGVGICGICTVLVDGEVLRSCVVPAGEVVDREVTTIEGLAARGDRVLSAWLEEQVPQCGYCQPGQIVAAVGLLRDHPDPSEAQIDEAMAGVLCRCGTYQRVRRAVHAAAAMADAGPPPVEPPAEPGVVLDDWIRIAPDGTVTIQINHSEMGQGVSTALALLIAEELEADPARLRTEFAPADPRYRNPLFGSQTTGGSTSVRGEWERLSLVGAQARERLIQAAAQRWGVKARACVAEAGTVVHGAGGERLGYGELAAEAARIAPPERVALKSRRECRLLGKALPRLDIPDMVAGRAVYGMDVVLPGMRVASVVRCPVFGGTLDSVAVDDALAVPGVESVVEFERGVAVVARDTWSALRGREAVEVYWDLGLNTELSNTTIEAQLMSALEEPGNARQRAGRTDPALRRAEHVVEADYGTATLAHGTLEPMNCIARVTGEGCEVWLGTQDQEGAREAAAQVSGLPLAEVQVHSQYLGGGFGRRVESDMVAEAVELAMAIEAPVQVVWTRADDMQHDFYRPAYRARLRAGLDAEGWPLAWWQRGAGQSLAGEAHGDLAYAIPNICREFVEVESPVPSGSWRSVGAGQDAFAVESFIDELAHAAGADPFEFRRALLRDAPRDRAVLEQAAQAAGWGSSAPAGRHRGIAVYRCFGSHVAEVAEVSVEEAGIRVHRVVCAIDCGRIVNPDIIRAQMEGGIALGISAALKEAVIIENGRVTQSSFRDYPILTLAEMPVVEVHIAESDQPPGGVGEPGVPPIAPAIANAVAAATGKRWRELPLRL